MIIKDINYDDKKNKFIITTDTNKTFSLEYDDYEKFNIHKDMEIDEKLNEHLLYTSNFSEALEVSLNFLSYKLRSEKELITKLKSKKYSEEIIDSVISKLKDLDLIDDYYYAKTFINDRLNLTNYSKKRIMNDLYLKGIDKKIYADYLDEVLDFDVEFENAKKIVDKKINQWQLKYEGFALKNKIVSFLIQKGFSYDVAKRVSELY